MARGPDWESPIDRFFREEQERRRLFEDAARPFGSVIGTSGTGAWAEMERQSLTLSNAIQNLVDPPGFRALREATLERDLVTQQLINATSNIRKQIDLTTKALRPILDQLVGGMSYQDSVLREARGASAWADQMSNTAAAAMRAQHGIDAFLASVMSGSVANAELTEARRIERLKRSLNDLASSTTPAESARHLTRFFRALSAAVGTLGDNTIEELKRTGLIGWLVIALTLLAFIDALEPTELSPKDAAALEETRKSAEEMQLRVRELADLVRKEDAEFLKDLRRGEVLRVANVRARPAKDGPIIGRLQTGEVVAIVMRRGKWLRVAYREKLTEQLVQGWLYGTLVLEFRNEGERGSR